MEYLTSILIMVVLVTFSAYFSATETAFSSLNRARLKADAERGDKRAAEVLKLASDFDRLLSTLLIGNNIVNIATSSIGTVMFIQLLNDPDKGASISTIVVTIVVLIFGEITPKSVAKEAPEGFARFSAPLLKLFMWILLPLSWIFGLWKKLISKLFRVKDDRSMTQEELSVIVDEAGEGGGIDSDEVELLRSALEFTEQEAGDILTPRVDLEAVPLDADAETVASAFRSSRFSRLPVYEGSIDNIVGVVHQKDFYDCGIGEGGLASIMSQPVYVPPSIRISALLKTLQKAKAHMAVVTDEYGGTLGIVTMEDILEELVGDIWDEHDEVVEELHQTGEDSYRVSGSAELDEIFERFDLACESESVTLSGWIMEQLGRIPKPGDNFIFDGLRFTVLSVDSRRVTEAEIKKLPPIDNGDEK